jgi:hypothetical protein
VSITHPLPLPPKRHAHTPGGRSQVPAPEQERSRWNRRGLRNLREKIQRAERRRRRGEERLAPDRARESLCRAQGLDRQRRARLRRHAPGPGSARSGGRRQARQMLRKLLHEPMAVTPFLEGTRRGFRFEGRLVLDWLVSGEVANSLSAFSSSRRDVSIWKTFLPTVTSLAEWTRPARRQLFDRTSARPRP